MLVLKMQPNRHLKSVFNCEHLFFVLSKINYIVCTALVHKTIKLMTHLMFVCLQAMSIYKSLGSATSTSIGTPAFTDGKSTSFDDDKNRVNEFLDNVDNLSERDLQMKPPTIKQTEDTTKDPGRH